MKISADVVRAVHPGKVPVEAELGTVGVPDDTVTECVKRGICKVNYATAQQ